MHSRPQYPLSISPEWSLGFAAYHLVLWLLLQSQDGRESLVTGKWRLMGASLSGAQWGQIQASRPQVHVLSSSPDGPVEEFKPKPR